MLGTPIQFPYPEIPDTTPSKRYLFLSFDKGPNLSEFKSAIGLAPMANISRTMPPIPVAAPWYGSMADGWLWDSILKTIAYPSPISTTPAFSSPGFTKSLGLSEANNLSNGFECLYPQCSLQRDPNNPSSR